MLSPHETASLAAKQLTIGGPEGPVITQRALSPRRVSGSRGFSLVSSTFNSTFNSTFDSTFDSI
jgi:hypothetical protein